LLENIINLVKNCCKTIREKMKKYNETTVTNRMRWYNHTAYRT